MVKRQIHVACLKTSTSIMFYVLIQQYTLCVYTQVCTVNRVPGTQKFQIDKLMNICVFYCFFVFYLNYKV